MKRIFSLTLFSLFSIAGYSDIPLQTDKTFFYCPERIECHETGECEIIGEDSALFKFYYRPKTVHEETYYFERATFWEPGTIATIYDWPIEQYTFNWCNYRQKGGDNTVSLVALNGMNMAPLDEYWTNWYLYKYNDNHTLTCPSDKYTQCPWKKWNGLLIESFVRYPNGKIIMKTGEPGVPAPIRVEFGRHPKWGQRVMALDKAMLNEICSFSRKCVIRVYVTLPQKTVTHTGQVIINNDLGNKIVEIIPLDKNPIITMKLNPVTKNTIMFMLNDPKLNDFTSIPISPDGNSD